MTYSSGTGGVLSGLSSPSNSGCGVSSGVDFLGAGVTWSRLTLRSSPDSTYVYDVGRVICVMYDERADGPACKLVLLLVVRRKDVVTNTDTFVPCRDIRVKVTLIALLSLLQGLYDGWDLLS